MWASLPTKSDNRLSLPRQREVIFSVRRGRRTLREKYKRADDIRPYGTKNKRGLNALFLICLCFAIDTAIGAFIIR